MTQQYRPNVSDAVMATWDSYVNQSAQEFMDLSRQGNPAITHAQAAHDYAAHINEMFNTQADHLSAEQIDAIETALYRYLDATQGTEWDITPPAYETLAEAFQRETGVTAEVGSYRVNVSESSDDETDGYLLTICAGAMPPHASHSFATLAEVDAYLASGAVLNTTKFRWLAFEEE